MDVTKLREASVLVIGDCMVDRNCYGDVKRISPEAPVPVVLMEREEDILGGAANVARNIAVLGAKVQLVGVCGADRDGIALQKLLHESGIGCGVLEDPDRPTTVKKRIFARNQQLLRIDTEKKVPVSERVRSVLLSTIAEHLEGCGSIVISDYGKGVIYRGLIADIKAAARQLGIECPRILVDPKPANAGCYEGAWLLTPNASESGEMAGIELDSPEAENESGRRLLEKFHSDHVLTTLGARGMKLFSAEGGIWHAGTVARQVFDVSGAGDTVIAVLAAAVACGMELTEACSMANTAAGIVVGKLGTAAVTPEELAAGCPCVMRKIAD